MNERVILAVTGASGAAYAMRLLEVLLAAGREVHLTISAAAQTVIREELDLPLDIDQFAPESLRLGHATEGSDAKLARVRELSGSIPQSGLSREGTLTYHHFRDVGAPIASGSFPTAGMVICPCSGATLSAIVHSTSANLIHRAAEVHVKERRRLVLVPRETPLSLFYLDNLRRAAEAGATILPAMPGFYHRPSCVRDLVDFVVARICDQLGVANELVGRWGG
ncbi:MAG: UbiX family flavin prenyltransferase [Planctomycetota bacterium]